MNKYIYPTYLKTILENPDAVYFRRFWGERSELRRFQDGAVKEVVVWGNQKDAVIGDIARAVAARHHPGVDVEEHGSWHAKILTGDGGEAARDELDKLTPVLYGLEDLPLKVAGVSGFGEEFRLARVAARCTGWRIGGKIAKEVDGMAKLLDKPGMAPQHIQCLDIMLQAEHSGKWPKDEEAVRRLRVAWLHEVGKALAARVEGLRYKILGEELIVIPPSRSVVLSFCVGEKGAGYTGNICQLASWLASIALANPAWSGGVRLAKRWVSAHLLADVLTPTTVEVIMASIFLNPAGLGHPPASPGAALFRFLQLISSHDWNEAPLIVSTDMVACAAKRSELPPLAVISPQDPTPSYWTSPGPSWTQLNRLVNLAAQTLELANAKVIQRYIV